MHQADAQDPEDDCEQVQASGGNDFQHYLEEDDDGKYSDDDGHGELLSPGATNTSFYCPIFDCDTILGSVNERTIHFKNDHQSILML